MSYPRNKKFLIGLFTLNILFSFGCQDKVFVSTGTLVGLEATPGDGNTQSPQVSFGYKRSEVALVPVKESEGPGYDRESRAPVKKGTDAYSVLATFNMAHNWFNATRIEQFIATGHAARDIQKENSEFPKELVAQLDEGDLLAKKLDTLLDQEKDGACWTALRNWKNQEFPNVSDRKFARHPDFSGQREKALNFDPMRSACTGKL